MNLLKRLGAIAAGIIVGAILSIVTDLILEKVAGIPANSVTILMLAIVYRNIYNVLSGYIVAKLAPSKPMRLVMVTGILGFAANLAGGVAMWDLGNHWYPLILTITAFPTIWYGGKLAVKSISN